MGIHETFNLAAQVRGGSIPSTFSMKNEKVSLPDCKEPRQICVCRDKNGKCQLRLINDAKIPRPKITDGWDTPCSPQGRKNHSGFSSSNKAASHKKQNSGRVKR